MCKHISVLFSISLCQVWFDCCVYVLHMWKRGVSEGNRLKRTLGDYFCTLTTASKWYFFLFEKKMSGFIHFIIWCFISKKESSPILFRIFTKLRFLVLEGCSYFSHNSWWNLQNLCTVWKMLMTMYLVMVTIIKALIYAIECTLSLHASKWFERFNWNLKSRSRNLKSRSLLKP